MADHTLLQQLLTDHVGQEVTLFLRDYTMIDGTHARSVERQGVVYRVTDEDVALLTVSQYSREAVVHVIKLEHIMELQGRKLGRAVQEWFAGTEAARRMQWKGLSPWDATRGEPREDR